MLVTGHTDFLTLSLHDALPIWRIVEAPRSDHQILDRARGEQVARRPADIDAEVLRAADHAAVTQVLDRAPVARDRKSTRLNSSHVEITYAVFCLKNK